MKTMNDGIVYLISYLITPLVLMIAGLLSWRNPPQYGGSIGYRTKRSSSSEQAWYFAQVFWGRLVLFMDIPVLAVSVGAGVFQTVKALSDDAGFVICCIVITIQLVPLFVSIAATESQLKKHF